MNLPHHKRIWNQICNIKSFPNHQKFFRYIFQICLITVFLSNNVLNLIAQAALSWFYIVSQFFHKILLIQNLGKHTSICFYGILHCQSCFKFSSWNQFFCFNLFVRNFFSKRENQIQKSHFSYFSNYWNRIFNFCRRLLFCHRRKHFSIRKPILPILLFLFLFFFQQSLTFLLCRVHFTFIIFNGSFTFYLIALSLRFNCLFLHILNFV